MEQIKFDFHRVAARRDILGFLEDRIGGDFYKKIGENPRAWIDELAMINHMLTREGLVEGIGIYEPPLEDPEFKELGNGTYLYRGQNRMLTGLWVKREVSSSDSSRKIEWSHFRMGDLAKIRINQEFSDIPPEEFLPENFERTGKRVQKEKDGQGEKRPIFIFSANDNTIYAKGALIECSCYYEHAKPMYRLTNLSSILKTTSKDEMDITLKLASAGVNVPAVVGYYEAPTEEFLFLTEVKGKSPDKFLRSHRNAIIEQDAKMLAALCLNGFRKQGFTDFDDKIFDGNKLYLIDVEECVDLYHPGVPDFREMLLNPQNTAKLAKFRRSQREMFSAMLKDALFGYRAILTTTKSLQADYIGAFYKRIGWSGPSQDDIKALTTFPKDYSTFDSWMSVMTDTD